VSESSKKQRCHFALAAVLTPCSSGQTARKTHGKITDETWHVLNPPSSQRARIDITHRDLGNFEKKIATQPQNRKKVKTQSKSSEHGRHGRQRPLQLGASSD
jgi:hypothetical protein